MHWLTCFSLMSFVMGLHGYGIGTHEDVLTECTNRFEFRHRLKETIKNCEHLVKSTPICGKNITIAYANHPPYVFQKKNGSIAGILPEMLRLALDTCCFGCSIPNFIGPFSHEDKFDQNVTVVMPIQTSKSINKYFGHDFIHMFEVKAVSFIGPLRKHDPNMMINVIIKAIVSTWPLFATALSMALTAGVAIWVMESPVNEKQFPQEFPRGPFEGFWWAVVSMTTVGYGDRSPRSVCARLFAMSWILVGITIFSMYAATLTSALTSSIIASHDIPLYKKTFAVLNTTSLGTIATMKQSAAHKSYSSIEDMRRGIHKKEVDGMVVEENIANYYVKHMEKHEKDQLELYYRMPITMSSYGILSFDKAITTLFDSFFKSNDDQRDIMAIYGMGEHRGEGLLDKRVVNGADIFASTELLSTTLISLTICTVCLICFGLSMRRWKASSSKAAKLSKEHEMLSVTVDPVNL